MTDLWSAHHENGTMGEWTAGKYNSGPVDSGLAATVVSTDHAHQGAYALKQTIDTSAGVAGCRQFRYEEVRDNVVPAGLWYSAWLYVPYRYRLTGDSWNVFQFKSKTAADIDTVVWAIDLKNRPDGTMYLSPRWKNDLVKGPTAADLPGGRRLTDGDLYAVLDLPKATWTRVECFLKQSADYTGSFEFWQDGLLVTRFANTTRSRIDAAAGTHNTWSLNNYSSGVLAVDPDDPVSTSANPARATLYWDDARIATTHKLR